MSQKLPAWLANKAHNLSFGQVFLQENNDIDIRYQRCPFIQVFSDTNFTDQSLAGWLHYMR